MRLTLSLKEEYERLFATCQPSSKNIVDYNVNKIIWNRELYKGVTADTDVPWYIVGLIHMMESGFRTTGHLHNGDTLQKRTTHVPKLRPKGGQPPFTWEESAIDALACSGVSTWKDWSLAGMLYLLERYNGFGYRKYHKETLSPYLWGLSNHYSCGKYASDGKFDATLTTNQAGVATVLRRLLDLPHVEIEQTEVKQYPGYILKRGCHHPEQVKVIQHRLQSIVRYGSELQVDGIFGEHTEKLVKIIQRRRVQLQVDGIVGKDTWDRLF